ncbi:hypothetical protein MATL_G00194920 [Megalops atlanticus]|uniref:Uncharacterized protein n=1 Tax=Megalops atlanticus TaxID=7932 RepID=A0A9D3PJC2_MEGAT|nr:hypothetical protein MATL_G00194920 [Megalops atlanticus]
MKLISFVVFTANILLKLALITGLNGGLVTRLNPGLALGGLNTALINGGGLIAQPQFAQVVPGISPFYMQGPVLPMGPLPYNPALGLPQQQQFLGQGALPAAGLPYYFGALPPFGVQQGVNPAQQQVMGQPYNVAAAPPNMSGAQQGVNPVQQQVMGNPSGAWNLNQQTAAPQAGPERRYKRSIPKKVCTKVLEPDNQNPSEIAPTPATTEYQPNPKLLKVR